MTKRRWLILGAVSALVFGVVARTLTATAPAIATPPKPPTGAPLPESPAESRIASDTRFHWREIWTVAVPGLRDVALAPDGSSLSWVDQGGGVRRILSVSGRTLWRTTPLPGVDRVVIGENGTVAAFSGLNPQQTGVTLLDPNRGGANARTTTLDGAVWSADVGGATDVAWVGSGERSVYAIGSQATGLPHWHTPGVPESVSVSANASRIALGTWQPAAVISCSLEKDGPCWRHTESEPDRNCHVLLSADGARVVVVSTRGPHETDISITMYDGHTGAPLWTADLPRDAVTPVSMLSADGNYLAVSYVRGRNAAPKLAYFDASGRRLYSDKGSALFQPRVACIAADGSTVTVQSGPDTLFTLSRTGNFISVLRLPKNPKTGATPTIERTISSENGRALLLYRGDGKLTLLRSGA